MSEYDIGIVAAAGNPHNDSYFDMQVEGFEKCASHWSKSGYKVHLEIVRGTEGQPNDTYTKGIAINQGIRKIHKQCEYIACTDVDLLIPPAVISDAMEFHKENPNWLFSQLSHQLHHWDGELNFNEAGNWDYPDNAKFDKLPIRFECIGAWMSMRSEMWIRCGGFSEEYIGWGSDDHEVKERAILHGMKFKAEESMIMHLAHPPRNYQSQENINRNEAIRSDPARKIRNFMGQTRHPDFVIAGAQKSGTTAVSWMLVKNPDVYMPRMTPGTFEIHHFDKPENYERGEQFYFSWFPSTFPQSMGQPSVVGEKTPNYTESVEVIERMHATIPDTKIIVILRDPTDRAYSALNHQHRHRLRWDGFDVMFGNRIDNEFHRQIVDLWNYGEKENQLFDWGVYYPRIKRLRELYDDKLLVLKFTELQDDPMSFMNKVCAHIGVSLMSEEQINIPRVNTAPYLFEMRDKDRLMVDAYFRPHNAELFELLGWESF